MKNILTRLSAVILLMLAVPVGVLAQRTITGVILSSEDHEPLIGASVSVSQTP